MPTCNSSLLFCQFQECCTKASCWHWPKAPRPLETCSASTGFYEGRFLEVLFERLMRILDQVRMGKGSLLGVANIAKTLEPGVSVAWKWQGETSFRGCFLL